MNNTYWKVKIRYGHVGQGKEVCVNRYLEMKESSSVQDVIRLIKTMPGVKKSTKAYKSIFKITHNQYIEGKKEEKENLYLQKLWAYHKKTA